MTRGASGEKVRFGVAEWTGLITVAVLLLGGVVDVRVQQAITSQQISELKIQTHEILRDHEARIRAIEAERRRQQEP